MPETLDTVEPASDGGCPLPHPGQTCAEFGMVELVNEAQVAVLHEPLKAAVGKHVTLHVQPGFGVTGTLSSYDEDTGVCLVTDRDRNYVAAGAVSVLQLRGTV